MPITATQHGPHRGRRRHCRYYVSRLAVGVLSVLLAIVADASAQAVTSDPPMPVMRWDLNGGFGMHFLDTRVFGESYTYWDVWWLPRFQIGRYFTPHLKAEFAVTTPHAYDFSEDERIPIPGLPDGGFAYTDHRVQSVTLTPLFTYQFLENAFAHPFVSAGVNISLLDEQVTRTQEVRRVGGITYMVPESSSKRSDVLVGAVFASGFKSYFNERTFVRPEVGFAFDPAGVTHVGLRLDFGIDF